MFFKCRAWINLEILKSFKFLHLVYEIEESILQKKEGVMDSWLLLFSSKLQKHIYLSAQLEAFHNIFPYCNFSLYLTSAWLFFCLFLFSDISDINRLDYTVSIDRKYCLMSMEELQQSEKKKKNTSKTMKRPYMFTQCPTPRYEKKLSILRSLLLCSYKKCLSQLVLPKGKLG